MAGNPPVEEREGGTPSARTDRREGAAVVPRREDAGMTRLRILPLLLVGLVVATATACGGDGDSGAATTAAATAADPRAGYFGEDESAALNAPLSAFAAADRRWVAGGDACNDEAGRLFDAGATPREAIACHLRRSTAMRDTSRDVRIAVVGIEGDFRPECVAELARYRATVTSMAASWQRVLGLWNAYGRGAAGQGDRITAAGDRAQDLTRSFIDEGEAGKALTVACYTEADRAEADAG